VCNERKRKNSAAAAIELGSHALSMRIVEIGKKHGD